MAKTKARIEGENLVESKPKPAKASAKKNSPKIILSKYFQYHGEGVHEYTRAFLNETFRGIIKTKEDWDDEIAQYREDS